MRGQASFRPPSAPPPAWSAARPSGPFLPCSRNDAEQGPGVCSTGMDPAAAVVSSGKGGGEPTPSLSCSQAWQPPSQHPTQAQSSALEAFRALLSQPPQPHHCAPFFDLRVRSHLPWALLQPPNRAGDWERQGSPLIIWARSWLSVLPRAGRFLLPVRQLRGSPLSELLPQGAFLPGASNAHWSTSPLKAASTSPRPFLSCRTPSCKRSSHGTSSSKATGQPLLGQAVFPAGPRHEAKLPGRLCCPGRVQNAGCPYAQPPYAQPPRN